jgi:hypothetical protein
MVAKKKDTNSLEAAYGLYIIGMEVANADGNIDEKEATELLRSCFIASKISTSKLVQEAGALVTEFDQLKAYRTADTRNHIAVLKDVNMMLDKLPESDRYRYLATLYSVGKAVAEASGGGWFSDGPVSDDEKKALMMVALLTSGSLEIKKVNAWIEKNGI